MEHEDAADSHAFDVAEDLLEELAKPEDRRDFQKAAAMAHELVAFCEERAQPTKRRSEHRP